MKLRRSNRLLLFFTLFLLFRHISTNNGKIICYLDNGDDMKNDIYILAHEIKNPLCVAKGYLEMLSLENFSKYKKIIQEEINDSLKILDNYLEFNRISVNKEEMDLNILLLDIKNNLKDYLKKKNVHLHIETIDEEVYLEADYDKLKQVFKNIIKNCVEANSRNIYINYRIMFGKVTISIKDDGIGMNPDTIYNIGNYYSNKENGNGIGTSLIKKIINLHDGKIKYRNNHKKGISVFITLTLS